MSASTPWKQSSYDVIVVGSQVAGAATALLLARHGLRAAVLDSRAAFADSLPTRPIMRGGMLQLSRWGLRDEIIATGASPVSRMTFRHGGQQTTMSVKPSHGVGTLYAPRAGVLQQLLVRAAQDAGVDVRFGTAVTDVIVRAGRVTGVRAIAAGGRPVEVGADLVVGADGVSSRVAQLVGAPIDRKGRHASVTTYAYWPDLAVDGYEFIFLPRLRAGLIPTNDGEVLAFASGPSAAIGAGGLGLIVDAISEASTDLGRRLRRAPAPRGLHTTAALRGAVRRSTGSGWALVGDAGFFKDPTAAHGLGDELRDAELLAAAIGAADRPWDGGALARFEATRNRAGLPLFEVVDRIAGHEWDSTEIAHLVMELNSAMSAEVDALAALEEIA